MGNTSDMDDGRNGANRAHIPLGGSGVMAGLAGILAAALTLGVAEIVAAFVHPRSSPVLAVGAAFIDVVPGWLKDWAIAAFGTYDKLALVTGIVIVLGLISALIGVLARVRLVWGAAGVGLLGAAAAAAAVSRPDATAVWALPALVGAAAGVASLHVLADRIPAASTQPPERRNGRASDNDRVRDPDAARRSFLLAGAGVAAVAATAGTAGRFLGGRRFAVSSSRAALQLPPPASPARHVSPAASLDVAGMPPFFTPNSGFYRIDTALALPRVPPDEWSLRVHGMVERELNLTFDDLLARPLIERTITLACVSNPVGGDLVGNARWLGVRLADVLAEAGIRHGADEVLSRSTDGWTCGTPVATIMDGRDAMLAVAMNGEPLPVAHGFPVRIVVPGLYGYVSATKWLEDIEVTTFAKKRPYWAMRGWSVRGPVKTMSRIDTPRAGADLRRGRIPVAGVAWAQHRGIRSVEVSVDGGPWQEARLAPVPSADTWRHWVHYWDAEPGEHHLQVRATDGRGRTQTARHAPPAPDGSTGWHTVTVHVAQGSPERASAVGPRYPGQFE